MRYPSLCCLLTEGFQVRVLAEEPNLFKGLAFKFRTAKNTSRCKLESRPPPASFPPLIAPLDPALPSPPESFRTGSPAAPFSSAVFPAWLITAGILRSVPHWRKPYGQPIVGGGDIAAALGCRSYHFCSAPWETNSLPVRALRIMEIFQYSCELKIWSTATLQPLASA